MKARKWTISFLVVYLVAIIGWAGFMVIVDPYFHYHAPIEGLAYILRNERSQNDGILKHFDYEGIITGTSMTENFKTSEAEELFGGKFVKAPFCGAKFKEIDDNLDVAFAHNPDIKYVIRGLDQYSFNVEKDEERDDLGVYPTYLYDDNVINDVFYVFNKDVAFGYAFPAVIERGRRSMTSFDDYANWQKGFVFGREQVMRGLGDLSYEEPSFEVDDTIRDRVRENVEQNIIATAKAHPDVDFYYFLPPYSAAHWGLMRSVGRLEPSVDVLRYATSLIVDVPNIKLYSFDDFYDITEDLSNYKDPEHYSEDVSSRILEWMRSGDGLLTKENFSSRYDGFLDHYRVIVF